MSIRRLLVRVARSFPVLLILPPVFVHIFLQTFTGFMENDDEGAIMLTHSGFARGLALYDDIYTPYGPAFYAIKYPLFHWFHHGEITHDLNRAVSAGLGMLVVVLFGLVTQRLCQSTLATAAVMIVVGWDAARFIHAEPGHPQELIMGLLALTYWVASTKWNVVLRFALLGALAAIFITIKINAGVFITLALASAILFSNTGTKLSASVRLLVSTLILILPLAMMSHLIFPASSWASIFRDTNESSTPWIYLALTVLMSSASYMQVLRKSPVDSPGAAVGPLRLLSVTAASGLVVCTLFCGFAMYRGSSLGGLADGFLIRPLDIVQNFTYGTPTSTRHLLLAILALLVAFSLSSHATNQNEPRRIRLLATIQALVGLFYFAFAFRAVLLGVGATLNPSAFLIAPWAWLVVLPPPDNAMPPARRFATSFIAMSTILFTLYVYPVAGSQMGCLHLLSALPAAILLTTGLRTLRAEFQWSLPEVSPGARAVQMTLGYGSIAIALVTCPSFRGGAREYLDRVPARHLPGAHELRLSREHYAKFLALAENTSAHSDGYITSTNTLLGVARLASLHYWSQQPPATYFYDNENWNEFLNDDEKRSTVNALDSMVRPAVVVSGYPLPWKDVLQEYVSKNFSPALAFGEFSICLKNSQLMGPLQTWILRKETSIADFDDQIPLIDGLLQNRLPCTLSVWLNTRAPGVLLGLQKSVTRESQIVVDHGWPLAYVSSSGDLCVAVPGQRFKARAIRTASRVDDQRWHHLCLQMESDRLTMWFDGQPCGDGPLPDFQSMPQAQLGGGAPFPQSSKAPWESFKGQIKGAVLIPGVVSPDQAAQL